jgi:hypothetical protein
MLELPFNMTLSIPTLYFEFLPFAQNLKPEFLNGAIALVAVGLTAAYIYYRKNPKGVFTTTLITSFC